MDNLDHHLPRIDRCEYVLTESFLFNLLSEVACYVVVNIGIKQGTAHIFERFGDVNLGDAPLTFEYFE